MAVKCVPQLLLSEKSAMPVAKFVGPGENLSREVMVGYKYIFPLTPCRKRPRH